MRVTSDVWVLPEWTKSREKIIKGEWFTWGILIVNDPLPVVSFDSSGATNATSSQAIGYWLGWLAPHVDS